VKVGSGGMIDRSSDGNERACTVVRTKVGNSTEFKLRSASRCSGTYLTLGGRISPASHPPLLPPPSLLPRSLPL